MQLESQVLSELDAIEGGHNNTCADIVMKDLKVPHAHNAFIQE